MRSAVKSIRQGHRTWMIKSCLIKYHEYFTKKKSVAMTAQWQYTSFLVGCIIKSWAKILCVTQDHCVTRTPHNERMNRKNIWSTDSKKLIKNTARSYKILSNILKLLIHTIF